MASYSGIRWLLSRLMTRVICSVADDEVQARREAPAQIAFYAAPRTYDTVIAPPG
jgi:hypothetical protein